MLPQVDYDGGIPVSALTLNKIDPCVVRCEIQHEFLFTPTSKEIQLLVKKFIWQKILTTPCPNVEAVAVRQPIEDVLRRVSLKFNSFFTNQKKCFLSERAVTVQIFFFAKWNKRLHGKCSCQSLCWIFYWSSKILLGYYQERAIAVFLRVFVLLWAEQKPIFIAQTNVWNFLRLSQKPLVVPAIIQQSSSPQHHTFWQVGCVHVSREAVVFVFPGALTVSSDRTLSYDIKWKSYLAIRKVWFFRKGASSQNCD